MNAVERQMRDILAEGRERWGYTAVKAEFEAEGTRMEELLRLVEIANRADLDVIVKIGGCEAVRDMLESKQIGVSYLIAPMVETGYALSKYILAKNKVYDADESEDTRFLFNLETTTGFQNREELVRESAVDRGVDGVVFGRVDYCGSLDLGRDAINDDRITEDVIETARLCRDADLELVVGGGVSMDSIPALRRVHEVHLTRFETRKVAFDSASLDRDDVADGLLEAVHFELLWLINKRNYYEAIEHEDEKRIEMLEARWGVLQKSREGT